MIKKYAYMLELNTDLNDEELSIGRRALIRSKKVKQDLDLCSQQVNIFETVFKENEQATPEDIMKQRARLRKFRDNCIKKFNNFKMSAFYLLECLEFFNTDTQTVKITNSFNAYIDELEDLANHFSELFDNLKSKEFVSKAIGLLDALEEKINDIIDMVDNRINKHVKENILSINWRDELASTLQKTIKENVPVLLELEKKNRS